MSRRSTVLLYAIIIALIVGCSGHAPTDPALTDDDSQTANTFIGHQSWGLWDISIDPDTGVVESVPLRTAEFNANVVKFLQPPSAPINLLTITIEPGTDLASGYVVLDISIRHPFFSYPQFRGFDVRGILMVEGNTIGINDPGIVYTSTDGTYVLNPDGYTRWWNQMEFTTYNTILGYTEGTRATPGFSATATLNPYKLFTDSLDEIQPVHSMNLDERATFSTDPGINVRRYKIQFDMDSGPYPMSFKYGVDASWSLPDPAFEPDYPIEAYDLSANCQEPFLAYVPLFEEIPYYESPLINGGDAVFLLTIGDWQADGPDYILNELSHIWVESQTLLGAPVDVLPTAEFVSSTHPKKATYRITVPGCHPSGLTDQQFLLTLESANPDSFMPQIEGDPYNFDWPDAPLAAYSIVDVPIDPEGPEPQEHPIVFTLPDLYPLYSDNNDDTEIFFENLIGWDIEGPYNENTTVKWWEGHLTEPPSAWQVWRFEDAALNLGYNFIRSSEPEFSPAGCRLIVMSFHKSGSCQFIPVTEDEIAEMKHFIAGGGLLGFALEGPSWCFHNEFDAFMDQINIPLSYTGTDSGDQATTNDITPHTLTQDVYSWHYYTYGDFNLEHDDCICLVRGVLGQNLVNLAPLLPD